MRRASSSAVTRTETRIGRRSGAAGAPRVSSGGDSGRPPLAPAARRAALLRHGLRVRGLLVGGGGRAGGGIGVGAPIRCALALVSLRLGRGHGRLATLLAPLEQLLRRRADDGREVGVLHVLVLVDAHPQQLPLLVDVRRPHEPLEDGPAPPHVGVVGHLVEQRVACARLAAAAAAAAREEGSDKLWRFGVG
eukprot:4039651-Pleurochrysis_carterae.AAC.1